jgi:Protein of unknown function (DUF2911).
MKLYCLLFAIFCLVSCEDQPSTTSNRPTIGKDSGIIKREAVNPYEPVDISPMDMSYLPNDYPILKMDNKTTKQPVARVIYSRPQMQRRKIFGSLVKYRERWRLGANEATEIELFQNVLVNNKSVPAGRYVLYCIPDSLKWTIVFNGNLDCWGLKQDPKKDQFKFDIPVSQKDKSIEYFTMVFDKTKTGADLIMAWDNVEARLPFQYQDK